MAERPLDVICVGRASVDLYGEQVGGLVEDMLSFAKYVGGCPANISVGTARLGLKSALLTRVGDEAMGRFIRRQLAAEGVNVSHVKTDPERLTALVVLGIRDDHNFPLIFYRENCADMAIEESDADPAFIASARALLVSGTHFSTPKVEGASRAVMAYAKAAGTKIVLDIDFRPVLWGLVGHGSGSNYYVPSAAVTAKLQDIAASCDLVVGTREEIHIAGGATDDIAALRALRERTAAPLVLKRGADGCAVFPGAIPDRVEDGLVFAGNKVRVFNAIGAGDAFMSGYLRGWLRGEPPETCALYANACGAIVVSRHGCAPAMATWEELTNYLARAPKLTRLDNDSYLNHLHRVTTRLRQWPQVHALAFDHRAPFEDLARRHRMGADAIKRFKFLVAEGARLGAAAAKTDAPGMIVDATYGGAVLSDMSGQGWWLARPIEFTGTIPLRFEGGDNVAATLRAWPAEHVVKCLVYYHPDDAGLERDEQEWRMRLLFDACVSTGHELMLELLPPKGRAYEGDALARAMDRIYFEGGAYPDWWKLPAPDAEGWEAIEDVIARRDPHCRGVILLGLAAEEEEIARGFRDAAPHDLCKGFAIGRSIFAKPAARWFAGEMNDEQVVAEVAASYKRLVDLWRNRAAL